MLELVKFRSFLLLILALTSCSSNTTDNSTLVQSVTQTPKIKVSSPTINNPSTTSTLKNKLKAISRLIGLNCDTSSQCKIIGVGVSPCGGFSSYSVYSEKSTDVNQLKENVSQFNQIMRVKNTKNKLVGICRHIEPPKIQCQQGHCSTLSNNLLL
ncbi:MAG: hypothetical protein COB38_05275 [Gammaproteobacteria bacterium]|nr:MAG: hypothetical protein COB38_05275 [Gammaproteobacteria bacterium]